MSFPNSDEKQVSSSVILYLGRQKMDIKEAKKCISAIHLGGVTVADSFALILSFKLFWMALRIEGCGHNVKQVSPPVCFARDAQ